MPNDAALLDQGNTYRCGAYSVLAGPPRSPIIRLVTSAGPLAVGGFVIPVVVRPLDSEPIGAAPHIPQEGFKRSVPLWADLDATTAVEPIGAVGGAVATVAHTTPDAPLARFAQAVPARDAAETFSVETATTGGFAGLQLVAGHDGDLATIAGTLPGNVAVASSTRLALNEESPNAATCEIIDRHRNSSLRCSGSRVLTHSAPFNFIGQAV